MQDDKKDVEIYIRSCEFLQGDIELKAIQSIFLTIIMQSKYSFLKR